MDLKAFDAFSFERVDKGQLYEVTTTISTTLF